MYQLQPSNRLKAHLLLKENIRSLLHARREDQHTLATWLGKSDAWISKALNADRDIRLKDFDRIADFFGIATYQLFQPGISPLTERRKTTDRRSGHDRRISQAQRAMRETVKVVAPARRRVEQDRRVAANERLKAARVSND